MEHLIAQFVEPLVDVFGLHRAKRFQIFRGQMLGAKAEDEGVHVVDEVHLEAAGRIEAGAHAREGDIVGAYHAAWEEETGEEKRDESRTNCGALIAAHPPSFQVH